MSSISIDTNAYQKILNHDESVRSVYADADTVYISAIVVGELYAGFYGGSRFDENEAKLKAFVQLPNVHLLTVTWETSQLFGQIKDQLRRKATMIPLNDIWIAAHARETGSTLISYDGHFQYIDGLSLWPEVKV
jgi:tRNA(fMet)-specific endonuclease VapC